MFNKILRTGVQQKPPASENAGGLFCGEEVASEILVDKTHIYTKTNLQQR